MLQENGINPYIWCFVGGLIGLVAGLVAGQKERIVVIENVLVGVFGAFIGGDFLVAMFSGVPPDDKVFHLRSLMAAIATAVVFLLALRLMRKIVGPMRASKQKTRRRD